MIIERPSNARGDVSLGWLQSRHTFSFGHYHDPAWMGFGPLRVINDEVIAPAEAQRRYGYDAPARAHLEWRAKQHERVFGRGEAPSDAGLVESEPLLGRR